MWIAANAVSSPVTPFGACSNGCSFSSAACGAWSVAMQSTTPERTASISAWRSASAASGGFIFTLASSERTASSVSSRWCGEASADTRTPTDRAQATSSIDSCVERCCRWMRPSS